MIDFSCPAHGVEHMALYQYRSGRVERRCLACQRERQATAHNNGERCRKAGHLKTPWTWKRYGKTQFGRCLPCQYARMKEKRRSAA